MPVSYDRGFCTTELNIKTEINKYFHNGFRLPKPSEPGVPKKEPENTMVPPGTEWTTEDADEPASLSREAKLEHDDPPKEDKTEGESPSKRALVTPESRIGANLRSTREASHDLLACDSIPLFPFGSTVLKNPRSGTVHSNPIGCNWKPLPTNSERISADEPEGSNTTRFSLLFCNLYMAMGAI